MNNNYSIVVYKHNDGVENVGNMTFAKVLDVIGSITTIVTIENGTILGYNSSDSKLMPVIALRGYGVQKHAVDYIIHRQMFVGILNRIGDNNE